MKKVFFILIFFIPSILFAESVIYLKARSPYKKNIKIGDIAKIESTTQTGINKIASIVLNDSFASDNFIDKREILSALRNAGVDDNIVIIGNSTRLKKITTNEENGEVQKIIVLKKGDFVKYRIKKNGIKIEVSGVSMSNAGIGDTIRVRLKHNKIVRGIVVNKMLVERKL